MASKGMYGDAMMCPGKCTYKLYVDMTWNAKDFPTDYPPNSHWSPTYVVSHDDRYVLWREGEIATQAIQQIAETGAGDLFTESVMECASEGTCGDSTSFPCEPFSGTCMGSGDITATSLYPYVSFATMVAPSPDWFAGVDSWALCQNGKWVEELEMYASAYDSGTDAGETYMSEDAPMAVKEPIFAFADIEPVQDNIFYNPIEYDAISQLKPNIRLCKISISESAVQERCTTTRNVQNSAARMYRVTEVPLPGI